MPEPAPRERLQPSLLDRLTDEEPGVTTESRDRRVLSMARLRQCVLRDLTWLFNAANLEQIEELEDLPEVAASTLNFGIPSIAASRLSGSRVSEFERQVKRAIVRFEPRILPSTLRVRTIVSDEMSARALSFEIEGEMWAEPVPLHLLLETDVDVESGVAKVWEAAESRIGNLG